MQIKYHNPKLALGICTALAMRRIDAAAEILVSKIKDNSNLAIKNPTYSRPMYKTGKYPNVWWTARDAVELKKSIRIVKKTHEDNPTNLRIYVGNKKAYWAAMFEYTATPKRGKRFIRPAIARSRAAMKAVIENG